MSSTDKQVTTDLIEILEDGRKGFTSAADKLNDTQRPDLAMKFQQFAAQRAEFSAELETLAAAYGDDIDESGSFLGAAHRGWMSVKDAISGASPEGVLEAAEQGESHAINEFGEALSQDISSGLRLVAERQLTDIRKAHAEVAALRQAS